MGRGCQEIGHLLSQGREGGEDEGSEWHGVAPSGGRGTEYMSVHLGNRQLWSGPTRESAFTTGDDSVLTLYEGLCARPRLWKAAVFPQTKMYDP